VLIPITYSQVRVEVVIPAIAYLTCTSKMRETLLLDMREIISGIATDQMYPAG
jgi:hypothetical protein